MNRSSDLRLQTVGIVSPLGSEALSFGELPPGLEEGEGSLWLLATTLPALCPIRTTPQEDWDEVHSLELTDEQLAQGRPLIEVMPELVDAVRKRRGPQKAPTKGLLTLRIDRDVIEAHRASGPSWQSRMNDVLREGVKVSDPESR